MSDANFAATEHRRRSVALNPRDRESGTRFSGTTVTISGRPSLEAAISSDRRRTLPFTAGESAALPAKSPRSVDRNLNCLWDH